MGSTLYINFKNLNLLKEKDKIESDYTISQSDFVELLPSINTVNYFNSFLVKQNLNFLKYKTIGMTNSFEDENSRLYIDVVKEIMTEGDISNEIINLNISPEYFYLHSIPQSTTIEAITTDINNNNKYFTTFFSKRDVDLRNKIYEIEIKLHENYKNNNFIFSIEHIDNSDEINSYIKNKTVIFCKPIKYAEFDKTPINY